MNLVRLSLRPDAKQQHHLLRTAVQRGAAFSATAMTPQQPHQSEGRLRVAAPPRAAWRIPPAAARLTGEQRNREARSAILPEVSHFILPRPSRPTTSAVMPQHPVQPSQQVGPAPPGDLRLLEFMEQVKHELWEFNAMPLRKRFRVQSLLRCVVVYASYNPQR